VTLLNQIIAVEPAVKSATYSTVTKLHHDTQRTQANGPFAGIARTYAPLVAPENGGEDLPGESTRVQWKIDDILTQIAKASTKLFDLIATKDYANTEAKGTISIDGAPLLPDVPVTYLLFLEKQLRDLHTIISKLPTLDLAESWHYDANRGCWATEPVRTARTKKNPQNHVLAPATDKHPAQVHLFTVDEIVGYWETIKFSGALPADRVAVLLERVEKLQRAVTFAREQANSRKVEDRKVGAILFDYLLAL
jgi:hypothetical protein